MAYSISKYQEDILFFLVYECVNRGKITTCKESKLNFFKPIMEAVWKGIIDLIDSPNIGDFKTYFIQ